MSLVKAALPFLGLLGMVALVVGGLAVLARDGGSATVTLDQEHGQEAAPGRPRLDAVAPAEIETATFALG